MSLSRSVRPLVLLATALLAACGFRLQGAEQFPPSFATTYIETSNTYSVFYRDLRAELEQGNAQVVDSAVRANAVIRVEQDEFGQRVLTVSGRNVPTEYDVFYRVRYSVWVNGEEVLVPQSLFLNQAYTYDPTTVLGKNRERDAILDELAKRLVRQVSRQLALL